jgi:subtilisin-like proprotein convertase family protein
MSVNRLPLTLATAVGVALATASGASAANFQYSGTGGSIPDNGPAFTSSVTVNRDIIIDDISVLLASFQHTWVGDLTATLTHTDSGTSITLFDRLGVPPDEFGSSSDLSGDYTFADSGVPLPEFPGDPVPQLTYQATSSFASLFAGLNARGTWTLAVQDSAEDDTGSFGSWNLDIEGEAVPEPASVLSLLALGAMGVGSTFKGKKKGDC